MRYTQFIICGYPRSGSSLLQHMMNISLPRTWYKFRSETSASEVLREPANAITKRPRDIFKYQEIINRNGLKKELWFIFTIRDPRMVVTSRHQKFKNDFLVSWNNVANKDRWKGLKDLHEAVMQHFSKSNVIVVKYEDLIKSPPKIQQMIKTKTGIEFERSFGDYIRFSKPHPGEKDKPLDRLLSTARMKLNAIEKRRLRQQLTEYPALLDMARDFGYIVGHDPLNVYGEEK